MIDSIQLRGLEPLNSTFTSEVHMMRSELEKLKREKTAGTGLISSLQRDLHSKVIEHRLKFQFQIKLIFVQEVELNKLINEMEEMRSESREKDLRLQSLQSQVRTKDKNHF